MVTCTATIDANASSFDFSLALYQAKRGRAIARKGWNGKDQFVVCMPELKLPPFSNSETARKVNDRTAQWIGPDTPLNSRPYLALKNAQGEWQPGWLPSSGDLFADDWYAFDAPFSVASNESDGE